MQLAALYMIGCRMALVRGKYSVPQAIGFMKKLLDAIPAMEAMIAQKDSTNPMRFLSDGVWITPFPWKAR